MVSLDPEDKTPEHYAVHCALCAENKKDPGFIDFMKTTTQAYVDPKWLELVEALNL